MFTSCTLSLSLLFLFFGKGSSVQVHICEEDNFNLETDVQVVSPGFPGFDVNADYECSCRISSNESFQLLKKVAEVSSLADHNAMKVYYEEERDEMKGFNIVNLIDSPLTNILTVHYVRHKSSRLAIETQGKFSLQLNASSPVHISCHNFDFPTTSSSTTTATTTSSKTTATTTSSTTTATTTSSTTTETTTSSTTTTATTTSLTTTATTTATTTSSTTTATTTSTAFEVENGGVERARKVVQKALKTIPYREEGEKMNIWMSYINLEFQYGSEDSLKAVLDDALKQCDQMKVMAHTRDMYEAAEKMDKSLEVCRNMARKFKDHPDTWTSFGRVLYHMGELQKARKLLAESLEKVDKRYHIEVTTKFALLEAKYGVVEESERIFKGILENFPRRTDIWSVYTDMLVKHGRIDEARKAMKKSSEVQMPIKKKKFILKKIVDFEEKFGNEDSVMEAKENYGDLDENKSVD